MASKIIPPERNKTHIAKMNCESSFYLHETSAEETMHIIDTLTEKKGIRQNDIPVKILKLCSEILFPFLGRLFNNCVNQWFPTGEEFLPREEFHEFRGGFSTS